VRWPVSLVPVLLLAVAALLASCGEKPEAAVVAAAKLPEVAGFVGSETCKECHPKKHRSWLTTAHAYSLREATPKTVAGRFDGKPIDSKFFRATPYRQGDDYYIRIEAKDKRPSGDHKVTRIVGRSFEQAYLMTGARGDWRVLPLCWSIERQEWDLTHETLADLLGGAPEFPAEYDSRQTLFNDGCGQCHATNYDVGHDIVTGEYRSSMLEGAVACESCHGPGSVHSKWHEGEFADGLAYEAPARLVQPLEDLDAKQVLDSCGRCHYIHEWRFAIGDDPLVGHHDIAVSRNFDRPGFFADGRLAGLNYHGSTQSQSACFLKGSMSCLHCHAMHGRRRFAMRYEGRDDAQCTQCHETSRYSGKAHSHHEKKDDVACVDCHMPKFLDGVLHFVRDHSIRSPEPELTERYGADQSPNACNGCHKEKSAAWAREQKEQQYKKPAPRRLVSDVGLVVALRRDPASVKTARLVAALKRGESPIFVRLTALDRLGDRSDPVARAAVREALTMGNVEIEQRACERLGRRPDPAAAAALLVLVGHKARTVRVAAAYALARTGWRSKSPAMERALEDSRGLIRRQKQVAPALQRIAMIADAVGDAALFEKSYKDALRLARWPADGWPNEAIDLLHRFARRTAESGDHKKALELYARVREFAGERWPPVLYIDSADSIAALGERARAEGIWKRVMRDYKPKHLLHTIAAARLARDPAPLVEVAALLEQDLAAGNRLQRVRWSLRAIAGK